MSSHKGKNSGAGKGKKGSKPGAESNGDEVLQAVVSAIPAWRGSAMRRDSRLTTAPATGPHGLVPG